MYLDVGHPFKDPPLFNAQELHSSTCFSLNRKVSGTQLQGTRSSRLIELH